MWIYSEENSKNGGRLEKVKNNIFHVKPKTIQLQRGSAENSWRLAVLLVIHLCTCGSESHNGKEKRSQSRSDEGQCSV